MLKQVNKTHLEARLDEQIRKGQELLKIPIHSMEHCENVRSKYYSWTEFNETLLKATSAPELLEMYVDSMLVSSIGGIPALWEEIKEIQDKITEKIRRLSSVRDQLDLYEDSSSSVKVPETSPSTRSSVFLVHGRNDGFIREVEHTIWALTNSRPTVLRECPNRGQTIIEKLGSDENSICFAVVLFTADDVGRLATDTNDNRRARQNVVFELGLFMERLGRNRICILLESDVEIFSDIDGLGYIRLDAGGKWKDSLNKELRAAGIDSDANRL